MKTAAIIAGPTASGKSALALARALDCNGVIVNADSMQVYAGLPILTAQPPEQDRRLAAHRLYGVLPVQKSCSAEIWRAMAITEIEAIWRQGQTPIIVGGTGLYINALLYGLSPVPDVPPEIRAESVVLQDELGNPAFHARLAQDDPAMAARLHPNDTQRLIRAWEVWRATGQSLAAWQALPKTGAPAGWQFEVTLVLPERDALYRNCDARFDTMLAQGALEEVEAFMADAPDALPITHALGYRPLRDYLRGHLSLEDAAILAKTETRQYAKRQMTWFRHQVRAAPNLRIGFA